MMREIRRVAAVIAAMLAVTASAQRIDIIWPTPHPAFDEGKPASKFLQEAGSGDPASGGFGGVRSAGRQFHEGIDIQAVNRNRRGEATDPVMAAMDGVVRYVNPSSGDSSYGRYIVLEHPGMAPAVFSLYAHLAAVDSRIRAGDSVRRGQVIGTMGRSANYRIPPNRAHLHFEMGLRMTNDFQSWFEWKKFGSPNPHGVYNGMNLMGFDPLDFLQAYRARKVDNFRDYFGQMKPVVTLRIATKKSPDFTERYPALVTRHLPMLIAGWEISFNWSGLPFRWTPVDATVVRGMSTGEVKVVHYDQAADEADQSKQLVRKSRGQWVPDNDLETVLQLLFKRR